MLDAKGNRQMEKIGVVRMECQKILKIEKKVGWIDKESLYMKNVGWIDREKLWVKKVGWK